MAATQHGEILQLILWGKKGYLLPGEQELYRRWNQHWQEWWQEWTPVREALDVQPYPYPGGTALSIIESRGPGDLGAHSMLPNPVFEKHTLLCVTGWGTCSSGEGGAL